MPRDMHAASAFVIRNESMFAGRRITSLSNKNIVLLSRYISFIYKVVN